MVVSIVVWRWDNRTVFPLFLKFVVKRDRSRQAFTYRRAAMLQHHLPSRVIGAIRSANIEATRGAS
jgi:hypothetical protein